MKRFRIPIAIAFAVLVGLIGWLLVKPSDEPSYKGKRLSAWLRSYEYVARSNSAGVAEESALDEIREAIRQIGTNAIPALLQLVRAKDPEWKVKFMGLLARQDIIRIRYVEADAWNWAGEFGFQALGTNAVAAVPALIQIASEDSPSVSQQCAIYALLEIGPAARQAIPYLLQWAIRTNNTAYAFDVSRAAKQALLRIDPEAAHKAGITNAEDRFRG